MKKFWDPRFQHFSVKVGPGDHYVTNKADEMITTTLGSCIAVCMRDTAQGIGGMNHFMLPQSETGNWGGASAAMRYGNYAMEVLVNDILRMGGARNRLEIKIFGGANVIRSSAEIGTRNIEFIQTYLRLEHMAIAAEDVGGKQGRRIVYFPSTGKVKLKRLSTQEITDVTQAEQNFKAEIENQAIEGSVELF